MLDIMYLFRAVERGFLCPWCRKDYLKIKSLPNGVSVVGCEVCEENWTTFRDLFITVAKDLRWGPDAWDTWVKAHPDYELPPPSEGGEE